jgi:ParB family chromosome partitioning protein
MKAKLKPELRQLPIERLTRGKFQPRREFNEENLRELADSIQSAGLIQPIVVRALNNNYYEIIAGERRWRAAQLASLSEVPCLVNDYTDEQAAAVAIIENISRVDLNPIEEADAYQRLIEEFNYLHEEIAVIVGKSRAKITNSLRLLKLENTVKQLIVAGHLSEGHGKVLAGLSAKQQKEIAQKCLTYGWSVRKVEQEAKKIQENIFSTAKEADPDIAKLEQSLSEHIGCRVNIDFSESHGQLKIDFHNLEILSGLLEKMGFKDN